jgi:hypothetical protein
MKFNLKDLRANPFEERENDTESNATRTQTKVLALNKVKASLNVHSSA